MSELLAVENDENSQRTRKKPQRRKRRNPREIYFPVAFWNWVSRQALAEGRKKAEIVRRGTRMYLCSDVAKERLATFEAQATQIQS